MPSNKLVIIYSIATGRIRKIVRPDDDAQIASVAIRQGEGLEVFDNKFDNVPDIQDALIQRTGKIPSDDRYAVVDKSENVVVWLLADPLCGDAIPEHELVKSADAVPGFKRVDGVLVDQRPPIDPDVIKAVPVEPAGDASGG